MAIDRIVVWCGKTECYHCVKTYDGYDSFCGKESGVIRLDDEGKCESLTYNGNGVAFTEGGN